MSIYAKIIGKFKVSVSDPSPSWIRLSYCGREEMLVHPHELSDLEHVCRVAREELQRQEKAPSNLR